MRNRSKDIISLIIKVCIWFLLNNKIFTFHDLFTYTESIDKPATATVQLIIINYYMCVGGGEEYCKMLANFVDFLFIVYAILLFQVPP